MQHTLNITPEELAKYPQKGYIKMKYNSDIYEGDTLHLTADRKQVSVQVTEVDTDHVRSGYAVYGVKQPGVTMLMEGRVKAAGGIPPDVDSLLPRYEPEDVAEILPPFSPVEKELLNS